VPEVFGRKWELGCLVKNFQDFVVDGVFIGTWEASFLVELSLSVGVTRNSLVVIFYVIGDSVKR